MQITLEAVQAKQAELAAMIAKLMAPAPTTITLGAATIELAPGELYAGAILNDDGSISHHVILLPDSTEDADWQTAVEWAKEAGGELPTRREQSLLFANLKREVEAGWYWSAESFDGNGSSAWYQYHGGYQSSLRKSARGRARAVRRVTA